MAKEKAAWTVIVYLASDNNLTTECMFALTEMKGAALNNDVNVIAQFDPSDPYLPSHRYEINQANESIYQDLLIARATTETEKFIEPFPTRIQLALLGALGGILLLFLTLVIVRRRRQRV